MRFIHGVILCFDAVPTRNGHWYNVSTSSSSFGTALTSVSQFMYNGMTGYLATITSAKENAFTSLVLSTAPAWIGGREFRHDGNWTWANGPEQGQAFVYTAWEQSVNFTNSQPDCAYANSSGSWGAQICTNNLPYVIEYCVIVNSTCARMFMHVFIRALNVCSRCLFLHHSDAV